MCINDSQTFLVLVLFDYLNKRYNMTPDTFSQMKHSKIVGTRHNNDYNLWLIGFHKVWLSWHLNEPCVWGNNPPSVRLLPEQEAETPAALCACACSRVCVYVCMGNTEATVVFMPAARMLSLPTALFHSLPRCFCLLVYVCRHIIPHSEAPAASASPLTGRADPVWQRQRGLLVWRC